MSKNDKYSPRKKKIYMTTKFLYIGGFLEFMEKRCDMTDMDNIDIYNRLVMHGKFRYDREDYKDCFGIFSRREAIRFMNLANRFRNINNHNNFFPKRAFSSIASYDDIDIPFYLCYDDIGSTKVNSDLK